MTWASCLAVAGAVLGLALITGRSDVLLLGGAGLIVPLLLAWRVEAGVLALILVRPSLDTFASSTIPSPSGHPVNPEAVVALLVIAVGVPAMVDHRRQLASAPAIRPYLAFAAIAAVGIPIAPSAGGAATEWLRLCSILVLYALAFIGASSPAAVRRLLGAVVLSALIPSAAGLAQFAVGGERTIGDFNRLTGTFVHPDPYGIYLALVFATALAVAVVDRGAARWASVAMMALVGTAMVGSYTRTAWVITAVAVLLIAIVRQRRLLLLAPLLAAALVIAVPSTTTRFNDISSPNQNPYGTGNSFNSRVQQWRLDLPKATRHPLTGIGLTGIVDQSPYAEHVHSDYVRSLVETGVFGFAAYIWLLIAALAGSVRAVRSAGRVGTLAAASMAGLAVTVCYMVASGDSNLITQMAVSGTAWATIAGGHAAGRLARSARGPTPSSVRQARPPRAASRRRHPSACASTSPPVRTT
jgi:O-antigen ligase